MCLIGNICHYRYVITEVAMGWTDYNDLTIVCSGYSVPIINCLPCDTYTAIYQ